MPPEIPAWALDADAAAGNRLTTPWPHRVTREWAWGGSDGGGARVCIVDSGVDADHPLVGGIDRAVAPFAGADGEIAIADDRAGDVSGHGTACAGIVRALAPGASITSVRVLGPDITGAADDLLAGLALGDRAAVRRHQHEPLHAQALGRAGPLPPRRRGLLRAARSLVACAHNLPVESFPWRFASVFSVAGHAGSDPFEIHCNAARPSSSTPAASTWRSPGRAARRSPPRGTRSPRRIWPRSARGSAAPIPALTPFQVKQLLYLTATNVEVAA